MARDPQPSHPAMGREGFLHVGRSAAEVYALGPRPRCECHGTEMWWSKSKIVHRGGYWICSVRHTAFRAAYRETHQEGFKENLRRWRAENPDLILLSTIRTGSKKRLINREVSRGNRSETS